MGANYSTKDSKHNKKDSKKHMSCGDMLDQVPDIKSFGKPISIPIFRSFDSSETLLKRFRYKHSGSSGENSVGSEAIDLTENRFALKVQTYLSSIEQLGEISNLKFYFGNLSLKTADGEYNVEVSERGEQKFVSLEEEVDSNNTFFLYTYNSSAQRLNNNYTYCSLLYITDVYSKKSKVHILQANAAWPYGKPSLIPSKIRTPDNPKLISNYSRFISTFQPEGVMQSMITFLTSNMDPFYLAQSDMSLDFTANEPNAAVFTFTPHKQDY
ncbi:hypothetical protein LOD99_12867 [Oopsacas minuta]|uniref:Uncharacterized protein n=1 Tax=Oopsacas minuta TaxID=111878 RepID=A0AAV7JD96_9METZ|nr:hypothetical protein LOD99_12867 [Oopsacas minuta]